MQKLTDKQKQILTFIDKYKTLEDEYPSVRTIGKEFNITVRAAQQHIVALKKKEYLLYKKPVTTCYEINRDKHGN